MEEQNSCNQPQHSWHKTLMMMTKKVKSFITRNSHVSNLNGLGSLKELHI